MGQEFIAKAETIIGVSPAKVWAALTDPEIVKERLFGTTVVSNWQVGSPLIYKGEWEGNAYEDKGTILEIIPEKILSSTYWSEMSGLPDLPENYQKVTYKLSAVPNGTRLSITQENVKTEESQNHSGENWAKVLTGLKNLLEK